MNWLSFDSNVYLSSVNLVLIVYFTDDFCIILNEIVFSLIVTAGFWVYLSEISSIVVPTGILLL